MKKFFSKIHQIIKASLPYTALLALIIGVVNIVLISKAQSDIEYTYNRVDEVESAVQNISTDYDNSDVISNIRQAHNSIVRHIDDAEDNLRRNIIIWGN
jgi:hypothetical protein